MIDLIGVRKAFGAQQVLTGVDVSFPRGKTSVIIGRSGTGKSVLLKHIIGLIAPDSGIVSVDGVKVANLSPIALLELRKRFGYLFQDAGLFDFMNVCDNVAFPLREHTKHSEREVRRIVEAKLALVGLHGVLHKFPSELSGGMRKRVGLARAIALEPQIILYDEPTTGLDPIMTDAIHKLMRRMQEELGVTSIVISHDIAAVFSLADYVGMLHGGKIIEFGSPEAMRASPSPVIQHFLEGIAMPEDI